MYHLRGVVLPDGVERDVWIDDGRITFEPVEGARTLDGAFLVPGLVDAHCHPGIGADGPTTLEQASEQALRDRDAGTLLIRDCGLPIDVRPLQQRDDLPRIIRSGQHLTLPKRYLPGLGLELDHPDHVAKPAYRLLALGAHPKLGQERRVGAAVERSLQPFRFLVEEFAHPALRPSAVYQWW